MRAWLPMLRRRESWTVIGWLKKNWTAVCLNSAPGAAPELLRMRSNQPSSQFSASTCAWMETKGMRGSEVSSVKDAAPPIKWGMASFYRLFRSHLQGVSAAVPLGAHYSGFPELKDR